MSPRLPSISKTAEHINARPSEVQGALDYAAAFPDEIQADIEQRDRDVERVRRMFPDLRGVSVDLTAADAPAS